MPARLGAHLQRAELQDRPHGCSAVAKHGKAIYSVKEWQRRRQATRGFLPAWAERRRGPVASLHLNAQV